MKSLMRLITVRDGPDDPGVEFSLHRRIPLREIYATLVNLETRARTEIRKNRKKK